LRGFTNENRQLRVKPSLRFTKGSANGTEGKKVACDRHSRALRLSQADWRIFGVDVSNKEVVRNGSAGGAAASAQG